MIEARRRLHLKKMLGSWGRPALAAAFAFLWAPALTGQDTNTVVALVLDTSGSVGAANVRRGRDLTLSLLQALPRGSEVMVLTFDDQSRVVVPRTSNPAEVRRRMAAVQMAGRHTALHDALYDASRTLQQAPGGRKAIVLVTDGKDENSALNLDDGLKLAQEARIPVFAVAVGTPQERVLRRIAKLTGGAYLSAPRVGAPALAARIGALPLAQAPPPPATAPADSAGRAGATPAPAGTGARAPVTAPPVRPNRLLLWGAGALALLAAVALVLASRRRRPGFSCPDCGRELANAYSVCPSCAAARPPQRKAPAGASAETLETEAVGDEPVSPPFEDLSPTVLARMNVTEEYLEKTITLKERPVLTITRGPGAGQVFDLSHQASTSLGRAKANDVVVNDVAVSSQHCRIRPEEGRFVLHDLKSTNGTFVNEKKVTRHVLAEGDVIRVGETSLQFRLDMRRD